MGRGFACHARHDDRIDEGGGFLYDTSSPSITDATVCKLLAGGEGVLSATMGSYSEPPTTWRVARSPEVRSSVASQRGIYSTGRHYRHDWFWVAGVRHLDVRSRKSSKQQEW